MRSNSSAEKQSVYSAASADCTDQQDLFEKTLLSSGTFSQILFCLIKIIRIKESENTRTWHSNTTTYPLVIIVIEPIEMTKKSGPYQIQPIWVRVDLGEIAMKEYFAYLKASSITGTSPSLFSVINRTLVKGVLPLCREAAVDFTTPVDRTLVGEVLPLCREAVGGFYNPSWLGNSLRGVLPICRDAVGGFYNPSWLGNSLRGVLPICRDAVGGFYHPSDWATRWGVLLLCREAVGGF